MTGLVAQSVGAPWSRLLARVSPAHRRGLFGVGWTSLAQLACMAIRLGSNLILTRLLDPAAFGVFGTALAVLTTLDWLSDLGVQPALIRHPDGARREFLITGWWMNLGRGLVLTVLAAALAYPLALAYGTPVLLPVLLALSLKPAFMGLRSPSMPMLRRTLNYRALFVDEVLQTIVATIVSVALAWATHSLWSIVLGTLAGAATCVAVSYVLCPTAPARAWDPIACREIGHLSRQVFFNTLIMALWMNLDRLLGLRWISATDMGYYAVAYNLMYAIEALMRRGCDVYFSMLSAYGDAHARDAWQRRISRAVAAWVMPVLAIAVATAPSIIGLMYDARYAAAKVLFGLLMARLMVRTLGQVQFQYLLALAQVRLNTQAYVVALVVQAALFLPLVRTWGVTGLAVSALASTITLGWMALGLTVLALQ